MRWGRLRWFGRVYRQYDSNIIKKIVSMELLSKGSRGRPKKTWGSRSMRITFSYECDPGTFNDIITI